MSVPTLRNDVTAAAASSSSSSSNIWEAAGEGDLARVKYLVDEQGMSPSVADQFTYTPLHAAASYGHAEVLRYLLSHPKCPPDAVNVTDSDGDTPLFVTEQPEIASILIEDFGADAKHRNHDERTALDAAVENDHDGLAVYLSEVTGAPIPPREEDEDELRFAALQQQEQEQQQQQHHSTAIASAAFAASGDSGDADRLSAHRADETMERVHQIMSRAQVRQDAAAAAAAGQVHATGDTQVQLTAQEEQELRQVVGDSVVRQILDGWHSTQGQS
ncbi:ankyrin [Tilletiaria anomala UBC 951]|uniref:Ankyrin n=1 Tax=Tilletiaria anomala (strain ATCC 24038 / CBS 436.72 / UBC 951) TaxID=1037660 RepID=A0A066WHV3_TILAU|nr:ankyrin [Tilletiaria anomala UBC 951]KDN52113.1 ankyrin [Tilletiaria anomala UBC 951]